MSAYVGPTDPAVRIALDLRVRAQTARVHATHAHRSREHAVRIAVAAELTNAAAAAAGMLTDPQRAELASAWRMVAL